MYSNNLVLQMRRAAAALLLAGLWANSTNAQQLGEFPIQVYGQMGSVGGGGGTPGGSSGQVQYNNSGAFGGLTNTQLTADINVATASLSGALPAWPNNTTTYFRGDGTYVTHNCAALTDSGTGCSATISLYALLSGATFTGPLVVSSTSFGLSGNISASGIFGTNGIRYKNVAATLNDTTSSGTIATNYADLWGGSTLTATGSTTITNNFGSYFKVPICSTNVTCTNNRALGADSAQFGGTSGVDILSTGSSLGLGASASYELRNVAASGTVPTLLPTKQSTTAGIGADTSNDVSIIANSTEMVRVTGTTVAMPTIASSSAAQTGTVCWTTGTGNLTVDTTTTCLLSLEETKNIQGNIDPMQAIAEEMKLKPFWFSYKPGSHQTDHAVHAGLGAHQVESVDKRLVGYDPKGKLQGVRYADSVTSLNVAAIKGLQQEIITLKAANDNLLQRVSRLERHK